MAITTSKYGTLDFSKSPISLNKVGDGTYAVEFGDYLYVPETTINKGVTSGDTQYYFPYFLNQDNLNTFAKNAESINLSSLPYGDVLSKNYGVSESGYLIPKSKSFDTTNASVPAEWGSITGLSVKDGQLIYGTTGRPGDSYGWISSSGVGSQPLPKRSGGLWGFVEDIGSTLVDAGPIVKLAALVSGNPYLYAASAGTDIAKGNYLGAAIGLAGASGNIPGVGATTAAAGEAAGAGLAEGAFPGLVEGTVASDAGIAALAPEAAAAVTSPVTSGAVAESAIPPVEYAPEVNVGTAAPTAPTGIEALNPNAGSLGAASDLGYTPAQAEALKNVTIDATSGFAPAEPVSGMDLAADATSGNTITQAGQGIAALPAEPSLPTSVPSTPMVPANPQDFGATIENGGVAPNTVANPVGTGDPGSAPLDTTSNLPGDSAGAPGSSYVTTPGGGVADITGAGTAAAAAGTGAGSGILPSIADATGLPLGVVQTLAAGLGISALGKVLQPSAAPSTQGSYSGPLRNIQYNPATYTPYTYKPYAGGGPVEGAMQDAQHTISVGYKENYPQLTPQLMSMASGGIANLGGYSDGGRLLRGPGDGVSDSIPAVIGGKQPARLADGEFVIPARIVSELGNGSTEAGARQLYAMMDRIQAARRKTVGKDKVAANTKAAKHLPA